MKQFIIFLFGVLNFSQLLAQEKIILQPIKDQPVWDLAWTPDSKFLTVAGDNNNAYIINREEGKVRSVLMFKHSDKIKAIAVSPIDTLMATGSSDERIWLWKWPEGVPLNQLVDLGSSGQFTIGTKNIRVNDVRFSPDGRFLASAGGAILSKRYQVQIFDVKSSAMVKILNGHTGIVNAVAYSHDGRFLFSGSADGSIRRWETSAFSESGVISTADNVFAGGFGEIFQIATSPTSALVAAGGMERNIQVWNSETGEKLFNLTGHLDAVPSICFSHNGKFLVSGGYDKTIIFWSMEDGRMTKQITDLPAPVYELAVSPDGKWLGIGLANGEVHIQPFSPKQSKVGVAEGKDNSIADRSITSRVSPFTNLKQDPFLVYEKGTHIDRIATALFSPDGKEVITASWDKTIRIWDAASGECTQVIRVPAGGGVQGQIFSMDRSPDGRYLIAAGSSLGAAFNKNTQEYIGHYVLLIDYASGKVLDAAPAHKQSIFAVSFSSDGNWVASGGGSFDNQVVRYKVDHQSKKLVQVAAASQTSFARNLYPRCENNKALGSVCDHVVSGLAFVPGTSDLMSIDYHGMLLKYDATMKNALLVGESTSRKGGRITNTLSKDAGITAIAMHPKGKAVAIGDKGGVVQLNSVKGSATQVNGSYESLLASVPPVERNHIYALAFSPQGDKLAVATRSRIDVYNVPDLMDGKTVAVNQKIFTIEKHKTDVFTLSFSPDGSKLLSGGENPQELFLWEATSGKLLQKLGKEAPLSVFSAVGINPEQPNIIGFGTGLLQNAQVNRHGRISRAFNLDKLQVEEAGPIHKYKTSWHMAREQQAPEPQLGSQAAMLGDQVLSYLPLGNNHTIVGSKFYTFLDNINYPLDLGGSRVYGMASSPDGKTFYTAQENGFIQIFDTKTTAKIASLHIADDNEWVIWCPDGYYTASINGAKSLGWHISHGAKISPEFFPFEQYDLRLNRPDIVLNRIGGVSNEFVQALKAAYLKRLRRMKIKEEDLSALPTLPELDLVLENKNITQEKITFSLKAKDENSGLHRLLVWVNDVPLYGQAGMDWPSQPKQSLSKQVEVLLTPGKNKVQVAVLNKAGIESLKETRYIQYEAPATLGDLYVLSIGVSSYQQSTFNLNYAAKDAQDIIKQFQEQQLYNQVHVKLISDENATLENIIAAKSWLNQSKPGDEVILFFAGHGLLDQDLNYYFATHDIDFTSPQLRGLPYESMAGLLDGIPARQKLMFIDACHSGEIDEDEVESISSQPVASGGKVVSRGFKNVKKKKLGIEASADLLSTLFADLRRGTGATIIASASGTELAFESDTWKNGVFTFTLLNALKSKAADINKDGKIVISELRDYVIKEVSAITQGKQRPTSRMENIENDFRIW